LSKIKGIQVSKLESLSQEAPALKGRGSSQEVGSWYNMGLEGSMQAYKLEIDRPDGPVTAFFYGEEVELRKHLTFGSYGFVAPQDVRIEQIALDDVGNKYWKVCYTVNSSVSRLFYCPLAILVESAVAKGNPFFVREATDEEIVRSGVRDSTE
jgi:hypothetical protein